MADSPYLTQFGIAEETTFGTQVADTYVFNPGTNTGAATVIEGQPPSLDPGLFQDQSIKYRNQPYADKNDSYTTQTGGVRVISMPEHPVRIPDLSRFLYAVIQIVVEGGATTYQKDFDIPSTYTQPDFSSNAGYFATLAIKDTVASRHRAFPSCILRSLTLSADMTSGADGRMKASGEWISGFAIDDTANFNTGSWAPYSQGYYNFAAPTTLSLDSNSFTCFGWSITINNNAERVGNDSSGNATNYSITPFDITGSVNVLYTGNAATHLGDFLAGQAVALQLSVGTDDATGWFDQSYPNIEFTGHEDDYANMIGRIVNLPFKVMGNTTGDALANLEVQDSNNFGW